MWDFTKVEGWSLTTCLHSQSVSSILALHQLAILCLSYIDSSKPCHEVKEVRMP